MSNLKRATVLLVVAGSCLPVSMAAVRQTAPSAPAPAQADQTVNQAVVYAVQGKVDIKTTPDGAFAPAQQGQAVPPGATIRTGPKSAVQLLVADSQLLTIDRISTVTLEQAIRSGDVNRTSVEMPYGRVLFNVTSTQFANDVQIKAPDATLAVRGTVGGIEFNGGRPTVAFGDASNRGRIEVSYATGAKSVISDSSRSTSSNPDPAMHKLASAFVEGGDAGARDDGEASVLSRTPGWGLLGPATLAGGGSVLTDGLRSVSSSIPQNWFVQAELASGVLERREIDSGRLRAVGMLPLALPIAGLAVVGDVQRGFSVLLLEGGRRGLSPNEPDQAYNELWTLNIGDGTGRGTSAEDQFTLVGKFVDAAPGQPVLRAPILTGLAAVNDGLFSISSSPGFELAQTELVRLDLRTSHIEPVMNFSSNFASLMLTGAPDRGSMYVVGREGGTDQVGGVFARMAVLEFDARNNYVVDSFSAAAGDFDVRSGTAINPSVNFADLQADSLTVEGAAVVRGKLQLAVRAFDGQRQSETRLQVGLDPATNFSDRRPFLSTVTPANTLGVSGIASAPPRGRGSSPTTLSNPEGAIDTTSINSLFAQMAYSRESLRSGVLQRMVASEIINTSLDPSGCATSSLVGMIPTAMLQHADQTKGIGRTVASLRGNLGPDHPCFPANMLPSY